VRLHLSNRVKNDVSQEVFNACATSALDADHPSARVEADLMSTTGVPSNTSIGPIFMRVPSISRDGARAGSVAPVSAYKTRR
jgi:hypothetical protein